jgi:hypothetical protein
MRIRNSIQIFTALTMVSTFAACGGHNARHQDGYSSTTVVEWDSRPLDENYRRERAAMEARHADEIAHARADEASDRREARQADERRDLEDRYKRGKERHMRDLPPSNHDHEGYNH